MFLEYLILNENIHDFKLFGWFNIWFYNELSLVMDLVLNWLYIGNNVGYLETN